MKLLYLILLTLCLVSPVWADGMIIGGSSADSCTGNLLFSWHMENADVTQGTPAGCSVGDTTGTVNSAATISATQFQDGSYSLSAPTSLDYYSFSVLSEDIIKHASGTIDTWVYVTTFISGASFVNTEVDANNWVSLRMHTFTTQQFRISHKAGAAERTATTTIAGGFANDTWYHIIAKWDETVHGSDYISICADTTTGTTNCGTGTVALGTWAGTLTVLNIGEARGSASAFYEDNIKLYGTWQ